MADLRTNRPGGVMTMHGLTLIEDSSPGLRLRIHEADAGQDWTGWTTDYAKITTPDMKTILVDLTVTLEADGWVQIDANLTQLTAALSPESIYKNGRPAKMTVRLKDPQMWPVYLIAPSNITVAQGPGALT